MLYFDHNATSPLCESARAAWLDATERLIGNPSSPHRIGARADAALDGARQKLSAWLGCDPFEIVWTSGATEANNTVVRHLAAAEGEAWVSAIEHPCVLASVRRYFPERHRLLPVRADGLVDLESLRDALSRARPAFVGLMAANNETGVLQPWREALALCRAAGTPFFCDAAQWIGKLPARGLGACDFVSGCAHKFGGPQGVGFLKCPVRTAPLLVGGKQEEGRRAGTENVAGVLAMVAALEAREALLQAGGIAARESWRDRFIRELTIALPEVRIVGADTARLWNTVSAVLPEADDCRQRWVVKLDKHGAAVSTGSACASGREETSHVLAAMGLAPEAASRVLRFSSGWETSAEDWAGLMESIRRVLGAIALPAS